MINLPKQFNYLLQVEECPKMVLEALKLYGLKEIVGEKHNPIILQMADTIGIGSIVNDDEQAWCGLLMGYCAVRAQKFVPMKSWDVLRALKWQVFGIAVAKDGAMLGDVLIFQRQGGGHVGLYVGEDKDHFYVLGGNQSNMVNITKIEKKRLFAVRRPVYQNQPKGVKKYFLTVNGPVSKNEA